MKKAIVFVACFFSCTHSLFSQSENSVKGDLAPPDTFPTYKFRSTKSISSLDSLEHSILDTLSDPTAFLMDTLPDDPSNYVCIAIKKHNGFVIFDPFENIESIAKTVSVNVSRAQIDGKGNEELIIEWSEQMWQHGFGAGYDASSQGIIIVDLDKLSRLMYYQSVLSSSSWYNEQEPDTTDSLYEPGVNTIETSNYEKYVVQISSKSLVIQQECNADDPAGDDPAPQNSPCDKTVYNYHLTKNGFILKK